MTGVINPSGLAARLLEARRSGAIFAVAPEEVPQTEAAAYAVQHAVAATLGPIGGWKVGAAGPDGSPSGAPLPASGIVEAPARLPQSYSDRLVEAEIAFRITCDLPPRDAAYTRDEVIAAIGGCHPVIEVVQWRIADWRPAPATLKLADNAGQEGALIVQEVKARSGNEGYNVATGEYVDLVKAGVVDPTKVTRYALQNAASISGLLLTTEALVCELPEKDKPAPAGGPGGGMGGMGGMDY